MGDFKRNNKQGFKRKSSGGFRGRFGRRESGDSENRFDRGSPDRNRAESGRNNFRKSERNKDLNKDLEMFDIICDKCGKNSQVPFKPTSSKPVFCRDCFRRNDNSDSKASSGKSAHPSQELVEINNKLDKIMKALNIEP